VGTCGNERSEELASCDRPARFTNSFKESVQPNVDRNGPQHARLDLRAAEGELPGRDVTAPRAIYHIIIM